MCCYLLLVEMKLTDFDQYSERSPQVLIIPFMGFGCDDCNLEQFICVRHYSRIWFAESLPWKWDQCCCRQTDKVTLIWTQPHHHFAVVVVAIISSLKIARLVATQAASVVAWLAGPSWPCVWAWRQGSLGGSGARRLWWSSYLNYIITWW